MNALIVSAALAAALALGTTMAFAQPAPHVGDGQNSVTPPYSYGIGGGAAHLGDGSDPNYLKTQHELITEPGYSIGTGSVAKNATTQSSNK